MERFRVLDVIAFVSLLEFCLILFFYMAADSDYHTSDSDPDAPSRSTSRRNANGNNAGHVNGSTAGAGYSWEDEYKRSWDVVQEDSSGSLAKAVEGLVTSSKRRRLLKDTTPLQRGIIRHLILILDLSSAMAEKDMRPTRYQLTITYSIDFINEYFEQNPISQLGVLGMKDGKCSRVSDLSGNPHDHILALQKLRTGEPSGDVSLLNSLSLARACLHHVPTHSTREILLIFGSLVSSDPGDIHLTIKDLVTDNIKVRVVGLSAQVAICREICRKTNNGDDRSFTQRVIVNDIGMYGVCLNELHFKDLLLETTIPPAEQKLQGSKKSNGTSLIMMGFPFRIIESSGSLCAWYVLLH
ncbi:TFIIH basal transcription factor complex p47 subunit [Neolecta irregularis DAH-3]|uniref:TFIIH basal transcription factor complex p47 subunit n=1 Tax=Neolecta irregularis (strain DAH-3) TaxID=1198029 RepID=A0A1U7LMM9_NEOID|nr:TFIIH basal transcription factor complex p47 subunit [Neolecta irregularis DAH-3]|eukprot:OLL23888.1 TFIIH basal transcription factor complex p47 subunit [Neolecta irregularis DAH-3]